MAQADSFQDPSLQPRPRDHRKPPTLPHRHRAVLDLQSDSRSGCDKVVERISLALNQTELSYRHYPYWRYTDTRGVPSRELNQASGAKYPDFEAQWKISIDPFPGNWFRAPFLVLA